MAPIVIQGPEREQEERAALEAVVHYGVEAGDVNGSLSHAESWAIARAVIVQLTANVRRTTTAIPGGFYVHAIVERDEWEEPR